VTFGKVGILLANLGTPDHYSYWPMRRYLNEFLSDKRVIDYSPWIWQPLLQLVILTKRPFSSGAAYKSIWNEEQGNESPLMTITKDQTAKMKARWKSAYGDEVVVDFCMRYGNPSTKSKVDALVAQGCTKILFFPLYPQYAGATSATACDSSSAPAEHQVAAHRAHGRALFRASALYRGARAIVERAYAGLENRPDVLVASYHGVPKRYLMEGDPYHCQCQKTSRLLKERLGWDDTEIVTTFQSRFGPEEWLKPYTVEEVARLAEQGKKRIAVSRPPFRRLHRDAGRDQRRDPRKLRGGGRRGVHLHPLPQRRRRAYRCAVRGRFAESERAGSEDDPFPAHRSSLCAITGRPV
jgi:ferrochelatase